MLNERVFFSIQIVAADTASWDIVDQIENDDELSDSVAFVGYVIIYFKFTCRFVYMHLYKCK